MGLAAIADLISHHSVLGATFWLNQHHGSLSVHRTVYDGTLVYEAGDGDYLMAIWSLRWEVIFSLLLPAFLLAGRKIRWDVLMIATFAFLMLKLSPAAAHFLPPFMLGVALAFGREQITRWMTTARQVGLLVIAVCGLTATWWLQTGFPGRHAGVLVSVGATAAVAAAMTPGFFARFLTTRPVHHVGRRSFTLYLVHEPIIVASAFALGGRPSFIVLCLVALPIIAVVTELFYRFIERPSHQLARSLGAWALTVRAGRPAELVGESGGSV
jgi:peptidoglycan/LPS O-acetylase OafA/YrhL